MGGGVEMGIGFLDLGFKEKHWLLKRHVTKRGIFSRSGSGENGYRDKCIVRGGGFGFRSVLYSEWSPYR